MVGGCGFIKSVTLDKMTTSEDIVKDYLATRLRRDGYNNNNVWNAHYPVPHPSPPMETMRLLGERFERAYFDSFDNMLDDFEVTSPDAEEHFNGVAGVLFNNGVKWGRIIGLLVFASKLSLKAIRPDIDRRDLVDKIVLWTCNVLRSAPVYNWMMDHNGWTGFVEYYQNPQNRNDVADGVQIHWPQIVTAGVATIAGAAAVFNFFNR